MGGLLALQAAYLEPHDFKSLFLISPYFRPAFQPQAWRLLAARFLNRVWPGLALNVGLKWTQFAKDTAVQMAIRDDSLSHQKMSARMAIQLIDTGEKRLTATDRLEVACLLVHGDGDTINSHDASKQFAKNQPRVEFASLAGGYHQIHNDSETRAQVMELLGRWLTR
jgi:alpha-beta hydrolase superfamily lysophospholipase